MNVLQNLDEKLTYYEEKFVVNWRLQRNAIVINNKIDNQLSVLGTLLKIISKYFISEIFTFAIAENKFWKNRTKAMAFYFVL